MNPLTWLEADMARHMLVEFPLAMTLGVLVARRCPRRIDAAIARFDAYGLTGWTVACLVAAYWMIPAALDAAVASVVVDAAKLASLVLAGFLLDGAMHRSPLALEAFFVGNYAWMTATVGLVYQDAESRLCLAYLEDSQRRAGFGLVVVAVAVLVAWFALRAGGAARAALTAGSGRDTRARQRNC